jgi:hypothetical protein
VYGAGVYVEDSVVGEEVVGFSISDFRFFDFRFFIVDGFIAAPRLKPVHLLWPGRGPEGPLFHGGAGGNPSFYT